MGNAQYSSKTRMSSEVNCLMELSGDMESIDNLKDLHTMVNLREECLMTEARSAMLMALITMVASRTTEGRVLESTCSLMVQNTLASLAKT